MAFLRSVCEGVGGLCDDWFCWIFDYRIRIMNSSAYDLSGVRLHGGGHYLPTHKVRREETFNSG